MARAGVPVLLAVLAAQNALVAALDYHDLTKLGVNFAIPADGYPPTLARKAADMGVVRIKLFDWSNETIYQLRKYYSFAEKKLEIMVAIPQWKANPPDGFGPRDWDAIADLLHTIRTNTDIVSGVFVYNEPCIHKFCDGQAGEDYIALLSYLTKELKDEGKTVTTPFSSPCLFPMVRIPFFQRVAGILQQTNSPITVNLYPYLDYCFIESIAVNYALGSQGIGGPLMGWSQIDADISRLRKDMQKLGPQFANTPLMIGESGWAHGYGAYPQGNVQRQNVWKVSNFDYSNQFYLNLVNRLQTLGLQGIYIFGLADESQKPAIFPAWEGEKFFGIAGLYADSSKAPWRIDEPSKHPPLKFPTMNKAAWARFHEEQGSLKWVAGNQPKYADRASEQLKFDASQAKKYIAEHHPHHAHHAQHHPVRELKYKHSNDEFVRASHHLVAYHHHGKEEQKWENGIQAPTSFSPFWGGYAAAGLMAVAGIVGIATLVRRSRSEHATVSLLEQDEAKLETCEE